MFPMLTATTYNVQYSLWMMLTGMVGIFIFMAVFYLLIWALEKFFTSRTEL